MEIDRSYGISILKKTEMLLINVFLMGKKLKVKYIYIYYQEKGRINVLYYQSHQYLQSRNPKKLSYGNINDI